MHFDDDSLAAPGPQEWWHAFISFPGGAGVTPQAATALAAALAGHRYHFTRKEGGLRLRARQDAGGVLGRLAADGLIAGWHERIYERDPGHSAAPTAWPSRTACSAPTAPPPSPQPAPRVAKNASSCSSPPWPAPPSSTPSKWATSGPSWRPSARQLTPCPRNAARTRSPPCAASSLPTPPSDRMPNQAGRAGSPRSRTPDGSWRSWPPADC